MPAAAQLAQPLIANSLESINKLLSLVSGQKFLRHYQWVLEAWQEWRRVRCTAS